MTLTSLRHNFLVECRKKAEKKKLTPQELTYIAKQMGHSRGMQEAYMWVVPEESQ
jgi:hypothetical protein